MKYFKIYNLFAFLLAGVLLFSCDKEYVDPTSATDAQILGSADGLTALAVGIQRRWSVGRQSPVYTTITGSGFTTFGLRLINPGNQAENGVALGGGDVDGDNGIVSNLWEQSLLTRNEAQLILDNIGVVGDEGTRAGLTAYASIFKALVNGTLVQFFDQAPIATGENAEFSNRAALMSDALSTLESARTTLASTTVPASFYAKVPNTIDLENTVNALLARFYLQNGDNTQAITAADRVDLSVMSVFGYDEVNTNPIAFVSILTNNVYQPVDLTLGLPVSIQPDPADERLAFYFQDLAPAGNDFRAAGFFDDNTASIPVYLPGEMLLIKAEAYARNNQLTEAVNELDAVLTKTAGTDAFGVGANLAAYAGPNDQSSILTEIYRNRCMELYMSGLRLEDTKRFGRAGAGETNEERNRNLYPYPNSERDNNTNTPSNPTI
ncbi:MAG: RagB/SusD family nutrient uptake outer membrane protein [Cyclobacteriaceae bacterium]|nr:RagB/SusD family nutrient uptake outer membrane protein [Cyclobacteriaceae bacterium HetDA_MAG_MS6]